MASAATVPAAHPASPSRSPSTTYTTPGGGKGSRGQSRMLRTLSRFLSGGTKQPKQAPSAPASPAPSPAIRPGFDHRGGSDPVHQGPTDTTNGHDGRRASFDSAAVDRRARGESRMSLGRSRSASVSTAGRDSSLIAQYPTDSLSHLSRPSTTSIRGPDGRRGNDDPDDEEDHDEAGTEDDDASSDASLYRLPPSTRGPSSVKSGRTAQTHDSTSSFAPTHASTHRSYASTKPTTLLSVDLGGGGGGGNRIAVVPGTGHHFAPAGSNPRATSSSHPNAAAPSSPGGMSTSTSGHSLATPPLGTAPSSPPTHPTQTFSSLSPTPFVPTHRPRPSTSSTSSSLSIPPLSGGSVLSRASGVELGVGIPSHTQAHPRNNPHPAQFPPDNASLLTLASSSFAPSFTLSTHAGAERPGPSTTTMVVGGGGGSTASGGGASGSGGRNYSWGGGGLTSLKAWSAKRGATGGGGGATTTTTTTASGKKSSGGGDVGFADEDASVRVLPGSRRNSEESLGGKSTWSAMVPNPNGPAGASGRSILSFKTGDGVAGPDERERDREVDKRRSSMRTFDTSGDKSRTGDRGSTHEAQDVVEPGEASRRTTGPEGDHDDAIETEEASDPSGGQAPMSRVVEAEGRGTEAEEVKKLAEERDGREGALAVHLGPVVERTTNDRETPVDEDRRDEPSGLAPPVATA
ncbi:hypothetical protein JCM10212_002506 [Sporobolomyces blumeae]